MIVCKKYFDSLNANSMCGATLTEVVLGIAVIVAISPFMYNQIIEMSNESQDIAHANEIVKVRDSAVNYVRINQDKWAETAEIKLSDEELKKISPVAHSGYIDKYKVNGASISDVYLAFSFEDSNYRTANIAKQIGEDAAVVREDGIAYSQSWAVSAPEDFHVGDLIFRISHDFEGIDKSRFLHRGTMGEDGLNQMQRNLHMNNFNVFNAAKIDGLSAKIIDVDSVFLESDVVDAKSVYFTSGANMNSDSITMTSMRVTGDTSGFRLIKADKLNSDRYTTSGKLIVDRATIGNSVNVAGNLILKSSSGRSVSGFSGISVNKLLTPYLSATDLVFFENFGITVSGELLLAGTAPLKIGSWAFPSTTPPTFSKLTLTRATVPPVPDADEFNKLIEQDWHTK